MGLKMAKEMLPGETAYGTRYCCVVDVDGRTFLNVNRPVSPQKDMNRSREIRRLPNGDYETDTLVMQRIYIRVGSTDSAYRKIEVVGKDALRQKAFQEAR